MSFMDDPQQAGREIDQEIQQKNKSFYDSSAPPSAVQLELSLIPRTKSSIPPSFETINNRDVS